MRERSTYEPLGCCLDTALLPVADGGAASQFDHKVDHIMTRDPKQVKLVKSSVTGRKPPERLLGLRPRRPLQRTEDLP